LILHCSTAAAKDLWFSKLKEVIAAGKEKDLSSTNVQITYYDAINRIEYVSLLIDISSPPACSGHIDGLYMFVFIHSK
jgi:hypothetical protein